jgi:hypothetical protein
VKKLISIGVALAVLALVVLPVGAAAQCEYDPGGGYGVIVPDTYAKIPFAILESGLAMVGGLLGTLAPVLSLPDWLDDIVFAIAPWTGGPLSWTVDMLGWGLALVGDILAPLASTLGLPDWLDDLVYGIACGLFTPFTCNVTGAAFDPCNP